MEALTVFLAIWGAVLSTIAIGWNVRRDLIDRGRLRVICYVGQLVGGPGPEDPIAKLVYNVTNIGRRAIVVTHIGGEFSKDRHFMVTTRGQMPRMLQPGEYFLEYVDNLAVLEENPTALWAIDSLGKRWKISRRQLRLLLSKHQKANAKRAGE